MMKQIYTYGGKPAKRNLSVADLRAAKGKKRFSQVTVSTAEEAEAAEQAGIDIISTFCPLTAEVRKGAKTTFLHSAMMLTDYRSDDSVIDAAFEALEDGADMVYTLRSLAMVQRLSEMNMPVMGHLGLVPRHSTWTGGLRAVGKTAEEAIELYRSFKRLEGAGAVAVEVEVVPEAVLAEINKRTSLITFSIGAGAAGDVQFLFIEDVCGDTLHPPRHARAYGNLRALRKQIADERVNALSAFHADVHSGAYPGQKETVGMDQGEFEAFLNALERGI